MASARLSVRAEVDAAGIALDIAERDPNRARDFYARLDYALSLLADFPRIGRVRPDLGTDQRAFLLDGRWTLIYSIGQQKCTVLRVVRGASR